MKLYLYEDKSTIHRICASDISNSKLISIVSRFFNLDQNMTMDVNVSTQHIHIYTSVDASKLIEYTLSIIASNEADAEIFPDTQETTLTVKEDIQTIQEDSDEVGDMCHYLNIILKDSTSTFLTDFIYTVIELLRYSQKYKLNVDEQALMIKQSMTKYTKSHDLYNAETKIMIDTVTVEMLNTLILVDSGEITIKKRKSRCIPLLCS